MCTRKSQTNRVSESSGHVRLFHRHFQATALTSARNPSSLPLNELSMYMTIALFLLSLLSLLIFRSYQSRGARDHLSRLNIYKDFVDPPSMTTSEPMATDPQENCPLFTLIPGEVRDRIFQFAVTDHAIRKEEYEKATHFYRPGFRFADQKLDTTLLRTCRRIYDETKHLPTENFVQVEWRYRPPPAGEGRRSRSSVFTYHCPDLEVVKSLHLFTQQYWLEDWQFHVKRIAKNMPNLQNIKITLRHGDWWNWETSVPLLFDPKQPGTPWLNRPTQAADPFDKKSWGYQFRSFPDLKLLELELESVEGKKTELDQIVQRAPGWQFPLSDTHVLALNPQLTTRTGRIGLTLRKSAMFLRSMYLCNLGDYRREQ